MSGYTVPNIAIILSLASIAILLARRLPEAEKQLSEQTDSHRVFSRWGWISRGWLRKLTRFLMEAKGLYHPAGASLRVKQLIATRQKVVEPQKKTIHPHLRDSHEKLAQKIELASPEESKLPADGHLKLSVRRPFSKVIETTANTLTRPKPAGKPQKALDSKGPEMAFQKKLAQDLKKAKRLLDEKQYARARRILMDLAPDFMDNSDVWARLGYAHYQIGDYVGSIKAYEYALALDSNQPNRYYNLSLAYLALGNPASALINIDKALVLEASEKYQQAKQHIITQSTKN